MIRALILAALLAGCTNRIPTAIRAQSSLHPRINVGVDSVHVGNYHCFSGSMLAWVGPHGELSAEVDGVTFYLQQPVNFPPWTVAVLASYAGSVSDTALPLVINTVPDSVGHAVGSFTYRFVSAPDSLSVDTLWATYRIGFQGGPWPNQVQSFTQWLAFDSTYAGVTP